MSGGVLPMWPTTIYQQTLPGHASMNEKLRAAILVHEAADQSRSLGVVKARKSSPDLLRWNTLETAWLTEAISDAIDAVSDQTAHASPPRTAHAWAVVYQPGGSHEIHGHHDSAWSGVYYVNADPDPAAGGTIDLFDPRATMLARHAGAGSASVRIHPYPGLMLVFPSWLLHSVAPVTGDQLRICIAFNVKFG